MPYDPIAKKEYDRLRNIKQKEDYLKIHPDFKQKIIKQTHSQPPVATNTSISTNKPMDNETVLNIIKLLMDLVERKSL